MSTPARKLSIIPSRPHPQRASKPRGVLSMVRTTFAPANRLAAIVGSVMGGFVPIASYLIAHYETHGWTDLRNLLVLGGLAYSARTVLQLAHKVFGEWVKAIGFCVLIEGVMVFSDLTWLAVAALMLLVAINAIGTAVNLVNGDVRP